VQEGPEIEWVKVMRRAHDPLWPGLARFPEKEEARKSLIG
jgi:hypothetical protein